MNEKKKRKVNQRVGDPTRSGEDFFGDTSGMTGVTTGSAAATSATPDDTGTDQAKDFLPGGILEETADTSDIGTIPEESISDRKYKKDLVRGMSLTAADVVNELASNPTPATPSKKKKKKEDEDIQVLKHAIGNMNQPSQSNFTADTYETIHPQQAHDNTKRKTKKEIENSVKWQKYNNFNSENTSGDDSANTDDINTLQAPYTQPENLGEQSVSGTTPDPSADDDTLENAHSVGTQLDEDEEHPEEIDVGRDMDEAENYLRTH
jgi:hypothetical protein